MSRTILLIDGTLGFFNKTLNLIARCDKIIQAIDRDNPEKSNIEDALFCHIILQFNQDFNNSLKIVYENHREQLKNIKRSDMQLYIAKVNQCWKSENDIQNILIVFGIQTAKQYFNDPDYDGIKGFLELRNDFAHSNIMLYNSKKRHNLYYDNIRKAQIIDCANRLLDKIDKDIQEIITSLQSS